MERGFLSHKASGGERCVKDKKHGSTNDVSYGIVNVGSSIVDESVAKNLGSNDVNTEKNHWNQTWELI